MEKILMHGDDQVAKLSFARGRLARVPKVFEPELLPEPARDLPSAEVALKHWALSRKLSTRRGDVKNVREFYGPEVFDSESARSLFDFYWLRSGDETWADINPRDPQNWDSETDRVFLSIVRPSELCEASDDASSPNLSMPGDAQRLWYRPSGEKDAVLLHCDAQSDMALYKAALKLKSSIVAPREYVILASCIYTASPTLARGNYERISFDSLYNAVADPSLSKPENLARCCEEYAIPQWESYIHELISVDAEAGNTGRNLDELGVIRDSGSLKILGFDKL